jgi:hypothetical protein
MRPVTNSHASRCRKARLEYSSLPDNRRNATNSSTQAASSWDNGIRRWSSHRPSSANSLTCLAADFGVNAKRSNSPMNSFAKPTQPVSTLTPAHSGLTRKTTMIVLS